MSKLLVFLLVLGLASCQSTESVKEKSSKENISTHSWKSKMHMMAMHLRNLTPFIYQEDQFSSPKNTQFIQENIAELSKTIQNFKKIPKNSFPEQDPALQVTLNRLQYDVQSAHQSFLSKNYSFSRNSLKNTAQYCVFCHTRRSTGLSLDLKVETASLEGVSPLEKSDYYTATRQFGQAKEILRKTLLSSSQESHFLKEKALKKLLLLELRKASDISGTLKILSQYQLHPETPDYMKDLLKTWSQDLSQLKSIPPYKRKTLKQLEKLMVSAQSRKKYFYDESVNMSFLVASQGLYDLLATSQSTQDRAKTYYLLGQSYEVLRDLGLWNLNEVYYESCIRTLQKTPLAKECYQQLEKSVSIGFSGSGGYFLPYSVRQFLQKMKEMAEPKKTSL